MAFGSSGLKNVRTEDLQRLLRVLHRGELPCPITPIGLGITGLLRLLDDLDILRGLDEDGVRAVLVSVLCERRA